MWRAKEVERIGPGMQSWKPSFIVWRRFIFLLAFFFLIYLHSLADMFIDTSLNVIWTLVQWMYIARLKPDMSLCVNKQSQHSGRPSLWRYCRICVKGANDWHGCLCGCGRVLFTKWHCWHFCLELETVFTYNTFCKCVVCHNPVSRHTASPASTHQDTQH